MILYSFIIPLNPITKKNSSRIVRYGAKTALLPSKQYCQYEKDCINLTKHLKLLEPINKPINLKCVFYMQTRRKVDLTNLLSAINDTLVKCGILEDDNSKIVVSMDGSRVRYDKECPRTEIEITEVTNEII